MLADFKPALAKVGPPITGSPCTWPGVDGLQGITNHYSQNVDPFLPDPTNTSLLESQPLAGMSGGRKRKSTKRKGKSTKRKGKSTKRKGTKRKSTKRKVKGTKRKGTKRKGKGTKRKGGSNHGNTLMPQALVNAGRSLDYNLRYGISEFTGSQPPVNPDPTDQPYIQA